MTEKNFKSWMNITPSQLQDATPATPVGPDPQAIQVEVARRITTALQPMVDRTQDATEQTYIIGGILGFAVGTALQTGMTGPDLVATVSALITQIQSAVSPSK